MEDSSTSVDGTAVKSGRAAKSAFRSAQDDSGTMDSDDSSTTPGQQLCGREQRDEQQGSASPLDSDSASASSDSPLRKRHHSHDQPREWID